MHVRLQLLLDNFKGDPHDAGRLNTRGETRGDMWVSPCTAIQAGIPVFGARMFHGAEWNLTGGLLQAGNSHSS